MVQKADNEQRKNGQDPVITVNEARKIMGKSSLKYSDGQLEKLIEELDMIAMLHFDIVPK